MTYFCVKLQIRDISDDEEELEQLRLAALLSLKKPFRNDMHNNLEKSAQPMRGKKRHYNPRNIRNVSNVYN